MILGRGLPSASSSRRRKPDTGPSRAPPEQLADAIEERYRVGALDLLTLHGLGNADQEDAPLNGLLPELRRRSLIDSDYVGNDFRSNLELPALPLPGFATARSA